MRTNSDEGDPYMRRLNQFLALAAVLPLACAASLASEAAAGKAAAPDTSSLFVPQAVKTTGLVVVEEHKITYEAEAGAGTIIVHLKGWMMQRRHPRVRRRSAHQRVRRWPRCCMSRT
jgi:hypothetical protein